MFDDFKVANYSKALVSPELFARHLSRLFSGDVVDGLTVVPGTGLQVVLQPGNTFIRYGSSAVASARLVSLVNTFTLNIATPDVSNPRHDLVVVYVDTSVSLPGGTPTTANLDGKGVAKAVVVTGTPSSSPNDPNATAIQAAIGSSAYSYTIVARVRVNAGVSVVAANLITDLRTSAKVQKAKVDFDSGIWWEEIGRTTLQSASATVNVDLSKQYRYYKVIFSGHASASGGIARLRVNNISGSTAYENRQIVGTPNSVSYAGGATPNLVGSGSVDPGTPLNMEAEISKSVTGGSISGEVSIGNGIAYRTGWAFVPISGGVTSFQAILENTTFAANSELVVLGHN